MTPTSSKQKAREKCCVTKSPTVISRLTGVPWFPLAGLHASIQHRRNKPLALTDLDTKPSHGPSHWQVLLGPVPVSKSHLHFSRPLHTFWLRALQGPLKVRKHKRRLTLYRSSPAALRGLTLPVGTSLLELAPFLESLAGLVEPP